jgi:hypothetical protein
MQPRTNPAPAGSVSVTAWYAGTVASAGDTGPSPEIDGDFFGDDEGALTQAIPAVYDLRSRFTGRKDAVAILERLFTTAIAERRSASRSSSASPAWARAAWSASSRGWPASAPPRCAC